MKFNPSPEFNKKNKERFLAVFDAHYPAGSIVRGVPAPRFVFIMKATAGAFAVCAIVFGGASVYADTANVSADNAFYPLKRLTETVQLAVTPSADKAELQATFASRRVAEIVDLAERTPTSTIITKLTDDADDAVNASITAAGKADIQDGKLTDLCGRLLSTVATSSAASHGALIGRADLLNRFTDQCETTADTAQGVRGGLRDNGMGNATSGAGTESSGTKIGNGGNGGNGLMGKRARGPMNATGTEDRPRTFAAPVFSPTPIIASTSTDNSEVTSTFPVPDLRMKINAYLDRHWSHNNGGDHGDNGASGTGGGDSNN